MSLRFMKSNGGHDSVTILCGGIKTIILSEELSRGTKVWEKENIS